MTFKQSQELGAHVRKGEKGSLVVYANRITRTEANEWWFLLWLFDDRCHCQPS